MPPESVEALLREGRRRLEEAGIDTAALDARLLLQHASGLSHEELIAAPWREPTKSAVADYRLALARRLAEEPVSRIAGVREFYGREFLVSPTVLDPRPDTETLVEAALSLLPAARKASILDLGTGSGAIIVSLLAERPLARGTATDISRAAIEIAAANARKHGVEERLTLLESDWWMSVAGRFDLVVSNPPYIPSGEIAALSRPVRDYDPRDALDGGADGCEAYRDIASGSASHLAPDGKLMVEIGAGQGENVMETFNRNGLVLHGEWCDLAGRTRALGFGHSQPSSEGATK
jgi:release factor glutamine methyltransferase